MVGEIGALVALVSVSLARVGYYKFLNPEARVRRTLARRSRTRIQDAAGRALRVTGHVRGRGEPLRAPVSNRPCVAYRLWVQEHNRNGWRTLLDAQEASSFVVFDESGEALVDPSGPFRLALAPDEGGGTGWTGRMGAARVQALQSLLGDRAINRFGGPKNLRYREGILTSGEIVSVGGHGVRELGAEGRGGGLRGSGEWLVLRGTAQEPLLISDSSAAT